MSSPDKKRILVVEDEGVTAMALKSNLVDLGFDVPAIVASGEDAILAAARLRPDLILMDITLAGRMNGIEAEARIRADLGIPVIFLTAHTDAATVAQAKVLEPCGYLPKPCSTETLLVTIEVALYKAEADAQRRKAVEALRQKQKVEAVVGLAGGVAHHLNNILSPVLGYAQLLSAKLPADSPLRQYPDEIAAAASRAAVLISQILSFARRQTMVMRPLDANELIRKNDQALRGSLCDNHELRLDLAPFLPTISGDAELLAQVLTHLAVNARDAMPRGGTLTIATAAAVLDGSFTQARPGLKPGPYVSLRVADTGCGMEEATRARLFEPFFTTKDVGRGIGLGLPMAYGIVKQHEGHIEVASAPGRGTTVTIWLPAIEDAAAAGVPET